MPKLVFKWNADDPNCAADFSYEGKLTRNIEAAGFEVHATLEGYLQGYGFLKFHLRIENRTQNATIIQPEVFAVKVVKPKQGTLHFQYPQRVASEVMKVILESGPRYFPTDRTTVRSGRTGQTIGTIDSVDPAAKQDIRELYATAREMSLKYAGTIVPKSIAKSALAARGFVEGDVYFEASNKAREILLREIIGEAAFDFPFITK